MADDQGRLSGVSRQLRGAPGSQQPALPAYVPQFLPELTNLIIDEPISDMIGGVLRRLIKDTQANSGMVLDRAGQIIVWDGSSYQDEMMQLGALIAGTYASTREMARILREENFRTLLQEGATEKIFTEAVGDHWLVSVIFGHQTHLGLVKVLCDRATSDLTGVLITAVERNRNRPRLLSAGLQQVTKDTIDLIFRDEPNKK